MEFPKDANMNALQKGIKPFGMLFIFWSSINPNKLNCKGE
jgi:hypothetical protein